ncbi:MAG: RNase adapter RapZ, partial [Pyrinomonadaceae bacterium]|nr:RNase adapter RapZ [Pyrinomonadaceae bacterium]
RCLVGSEMCIRDRYQREGKSYLMIGIGCTGGKHRSVMVANELAARLQGENFEISVAHRDMQK